METRYEVASGSSLYIKTTSCGRRNAATEFYPDFTDTSIKADNVPGCVSCQKEGMNQIWLSHPNVC